MAKRILFAGFQIQPVLFVADDDDTARQLPMKAVMIEAPDVEGWIAQAWPLELAKMRTELELAEATAEAEAQAQELAPLAAD